MLQAFDSLVLFVDDVKLVGDWYSKVLGFSLEFENKEYAYLNLGFGKIGFHPKDEKIGKGSSSQTVYWAVSNLNSAIETFTANGAKQIRGTYQVSDSEYVTMLSDPFGNTIGLQGQKL